MAIYAKLAGMGAALAVGLGAGVLLSVMNPLIPNEDQTTVAPAPEGAQQVSVSGESLPVVPKENRSPLVPVSGPAKQPRVDDEDTTPQVNQQQIAPVDAGQASELGALTAAQDALPQVIQEPVSGGAMQQVAGLTPPQGSDTVAKIVAPVRNSAVDVGTVGEMNAPDSAQQGAALILPDAEQVLPLAPEISVKTMQASVETLPDVATQPAAPVALAEPVVDVDAGGAVPEMPSGGGESQISMAQPDAVVSEPPMAAKPALPEGDATLVTPDNPARRFAKKDNVIKTGQSRLALNGSAGFTDKKPAQSGIAALKAKTQAAQPPVTQENIGALDKYAVAFTDGGKPLFSIIIMDNGEGAMAPRSLIKLPFPVTFAIPADLPDAEARAEIYRDAGFEVLALSPREVSMSLSGGLEQAQVDSVVTQIFTALPQAVGLVDRPKADLQRDRRLVKALVNRFKTTGHGLITYERGLNPVPRQAQQAGVYAGLIYKVLDRETQGASVIKRFLNRAGQLARRDGHIIVMGTSDAQTVAALVSWALSNKARGLALAPVSAVLRASR